MSVQIHRAGAASASVTAGLTQIATSTPGAVTSVDFASIPATYNDLVLVWSGVSCATATRGFTVKPSIATVFGGSNVYKYISAKNGTLDASAVKAGEISFGWTGANAMSQAAADTCQGTLIIRNYASTTVYKEFTFIQRAALGGTAADYYVSGLFLSTSAIDGLRMYWTTTANDAESAVNFDAGTFTLYGRI